MINFLSIALLYHLDLTKNEGRFIIVYKQPPDAKGIGRLFFS